MSTFRQHTQFSLNARLFLLEEELEASDSETHREQVRRAIEKNCSNFSQLVDLAGMLNFIPSERFSEMELSSLKDELPKLTLCPKTAASAVSFLSLLLPQPAGHSPANHFGPIFGPDSAVFRTFPYGFCLSREGKPMSCYVSWFFGESEARAIQIFMYLPHPWPSRIVDGSSAPPTGLLLEDQIPYQKELYDDRRSLILRFPKAYSPVSGALLSWHDVPLLREMSICGELDPCLCPPALPPQPPPAKRKEKTKAPPVVPEQFYRADVYVTAIPQAEPVKIGRFPFLICPSSRDDLLKLGDFLFWLREQVKLHECDPAKLVEILVILPSSECLRIGSGEIDW